jgi:hypothetical protein
VPTRAATPARREVLSNGIARRRAVATLRLIESLSGYCAGQLVAGLDPAGARLALLDVSAELATLAELLRTLALGELDTAGRRLLVAELVAAGASQRQAARLTGVHKKTAWSYVHGRW